jgi:hypothetical protein
VIFPRNRARHGANSAAKNVVLAVLGAATLVGLGGAIYWEAKGLSAKGDRSGLGDPHTLCGQGYSAPDCQTWTKSLADQDDASIKQMPFLLTGIGAGVALAMTAAFWTNDPKKIAIVPAASPTGAGLQVRGEF